MPNPKTTIVLLTFIIFASSLFYIFSTRLAVEAPHQQFQTVLSSSVRNKSERQHHQYDRNQEEENQNSMEKQGGAQRYSYSSVDQSKISAPQKGMTLVFSYADLEANLCRNFVDFPNKTEFRPESNKGPCPYKGIVSVVHGGRTGNQMWEYASVWAAARRTKLDPYIPKCMKVNLGQIFENLTLPTFEKIAHCPVLFSTFSGSMDKWQPTNQSLIFHRFTTQPGLVFPMIEEAVKEFRFRKEIRDRAQQNIMEFVKDLHPKQFTFVGVHVRRTDYIGYLERRYNIAAVEPEFFLHAMDYYRDKYSDCLFIYVSDDPTWCSDHFKHLDDVFVVQNNTPAVDMAIMAECNHSIFDYGTFGEWGSILAGGDVVTQNVHKGRAMEKWIRLD